MLKSQNLRDYIYIFQVDKPQFIQNNGDKFKTMETKTT